MKLSPPPIPTIIPFMHLRFLIFSPLVSQAVLRNYVWVPTARVLEKFCTISTQVPI